ncbi:putative 60S ribosomal export protein NMD3 [Blattamonas nauphoetae]|uniref:60S ribosomal export protein NMD3 n=1 Tax=Blattamonas nauphoetae TaxID=2049346 RepID=A0ABQ9YFY6_9EUKA|nr:putative 60S ribosomal export protein NMD3 [Blattamonas nauphoetae]
MEQFKPDLAVGNILCCMCGVSIPPNPSNKCANCLRTQVDITEGISRQNTLIFCRSCERFLQPPKSWITCQLESRELLTICLKALKGLNKVRLIDARFIWTEPHSRRVIVRLTVQKEAFGAILQQDFDVVYVVKTQQCDHCTRTMANDTWNAVVQLRQKVDHKRTFLYLEQLIIKHQAQKDCLNIKSFPDGIDFYFQNKHYASKFAQFIQDFVPTRMKESEQLISQDFRSNTTNTKIAISLNIAPVCRDDLVFLPKEISRKCGNISQLCLVHKVTQTIHLMDPNTMIFSECQGSLYWTSPFTSIASAADLTEFTVLDCVETDKSHGRFKQADVTLLRTRSHDTVSEVIVRSHLGLLLNPGDLVLGYDLQTLSVSDKLGEWKGYVPDVIIVRKTFPQSKKRLAHRKNWTMKRLTAEEGDDDGKRGTEDKQMRDEAIFIREIEEDKELRGTINLYKQEPKKSATRRVGEGVKEEEGDEDDESDVELIELKELVEDEKPEPAQSDEQDVAQMMEGLSVDK